MLGATGLLYFHYFGALLLPALALFHLFFVRKVRRWWQPVILLGLATLLALPQVPDLLGGIEYNQGQEKLHSKALHYPEATALLVRNLSNGLLQIEQPVSFLLTLALPLATVPLWLAQSAPSSAPRSNLVPLARQHPAVSCPCWLSMNCCRCWKRSAFVTC